MKNEEADFESLVPSRDVDRRTFLKTSGALAATGALPLALAAKPARKPLRILILGGTQLCAIGIVGQYISRIFEESKKRPLYFIAEDTGPAEPGR